MVFQVGKKSTSQIHPKYSIYLKYLDTSTLDHSCSKIWTSTIYYSMLCLKIAGWIASSVDPDETPHSAASHLGLHSLLRPVYPNTHSKYSILLLPHEVSFLIYCLIIKQTSPFFSLGPNKRYTGRHGIFSPAPGTRIVLEGPTLLL